MSIRYTHRLTRIPPLVSKRPYPIRFTSSSSSSNKPVSNTKPLSMIVHPNPPSAWFTSTKHFIDQWLKPRLDPYLQKIASSTTKLKQFRDVQDPKEALQRASKVLNELTGYDQIDAVKQKVQNQARLFESTRDQVQIAKQNYESAIATRSSTQREINELLQRKHVWQDEDVTRFTQLYRLEHEHAHQEQTTRQQYQEAERQMDREYMDLAKSIMERYHEEQLWSDKIRSVSTYGTWTLMVINVVLFLVVQTALEPRKRRRLTDRFEELLVAKMDESEAVVRRLVGDLEEKERVVLERQGAVMGALNQLLGHPLFDEEIVSAIKTRPTVMYQEPEVHEEETVSVLDPVSLVKEKEELMPMEEEAVLIEPVLMETVPPIELLSTDRIDDHLEEKISVRQDTVTLTPPTAAVVKPPPNTVRIHVNTLNQPRPVVFNYRQLYKRELKKLELPAPPPPVLTNSTEDAFYRELLKRAEGYAMMDEEANDDEDDEEEDGATHKKQDNGNEYDYEDPFIDDSEMLLDEPYEYSAPEFDGFFVYYGSLDGHENDKKSSTQKRSKATPSSTTKSTKPSTTSSTTTTTTTTTSSVNKKTNSATSSSAEKPRKKAATGPAEGESSKKKPATVTNKPKSSTTATTSSATKKPTNTVTATTSTKPVKKKKPEPTTTTTEQPQKQIQQSSAIQTPPPVTVEKATPPATAAASPASSTTSTTHKKKPTIPPTLKPLDPEIETLMKRLRHDVQFEKFENKAKFPLTLKPTVLEIGLIAFRNNRVIDDNLVYHLMNVLPYNRFTLKKFLTTKSGQMRVDELQQEIDELAILLKQTIDRMMPEQQRLFNEKLAASVEPTEVEDSTPTPRFKCNDEVRRILYDIIQTEEQSIHIANQVALHKDPEKKPESLASDGKARKLMYQRLLSCWPEGWMHTYEMSRQYSQYKTKLDKKMPVIDNNKKRKMKVVDANNTRTKKLKESSAVESASSSSPPVFQTPPPQPPSIATTAKPTTIPANNVITINSDDEEESQQQQQHQQQHQKAEMIYKPASSMSIESLISNNSNNGVVTEKK
ncbi:MAG: Mdm33 family-domain-containing protein [Benjaminiella poitrasii]|nr:MAG: Mdm33 family-domain-containing protein [Benjaminiella poitrasii]